jgi:tape measure domain-containing protein
MATEIEALVVRMEANLRGYERSLARANAVTGQAMRKIETDTSDTMRRVERLTDRIDFSGIGAGALSAARALGPLGAALSGILSIEGLRQATDSYTRTINALKVAGLEGAELDRVFTQIIGVAQRQGAPLEQLTRLYGSLAQAQGDLKVSSGQIVGLTEAVGQALRISGVPASQASGAILGLSQALSGGTLRAEEFNQMLEGGLRPALQAAANSITEAGGSVGKLRQLVVDGEVSSRAFFAAIEAGQPQLTALANKAGGTSAQALERLKTETILLVGEMDKAIGISAALASGINYIADAASGASAAISGAVGPINRFIDAASRLLGLVPELGAVAREPMIVDVNGKVLAGGGPLQSDSELARERNRAQGLSNLPAPVRKVSLADFPADKKAKGAGGGGKSASDYDREVEALNRKTAALNLEIQTFGQSAQAISKAKVEQELLNALQKDGVTVSEEQRVKVGELAAAFSETEARLKTMKDAQSSFNELQKFIGQNISSFFSDVVAGGKSASQALENLVKRLAEAALQAALLGQGPLAGLFGTAPSASGGVGGLIGALFGGFRAAGGPVSSGRAYVVGEKGPEVFMPGRSGSILPNGAVGAAAASRGARVAVGGISVTVNGSVGPNEMQQLRAELAASQAAQAEALRQVVAGEGKRASDRAWRAQ